jgi:DNA/RNA endonuclease YhcR with UshA esterase domain
MKNFFLPILILFIFFSCGKEKSEDISITRQENTQKQKFVEEVPVTEPKEDATKKNERAPVETIAAKETGDYIGKNVIVKGYVADVVIRPKVNYLNFDKKYPDQTFTAVIFPKDAENFNDLYAYKNKNVRVKGKIELYRGKPQIIINTPEQIEITE